MKKTYHATVVYEINGTEYKIQESDENIRLIPSVTETTDNTFEEQEIGLSIVNCSAQDIFLKYAILWTAASVEELQLGAAPYRVYRSGRHKNDMPGTFTLGVQDERLGDVLGAMTESGDKASAGQGARRVVSDHLTILQGSDKCLLITFPGGRKQLFETVITLDEARKIKSVEARVLFNCIVPTGTARESEPVKLVWTENTEGAVEQEIERFSVEKAKKFGARCGKRPAVFCTWYYYGLTVTYEDVKTNLDIMQNRKMPFDVFQVDEGWEITLGEWSPNEKFPVPMKQVAEEIKAAGYRPGIWTSPFIAHETASIWQEHPDWRLCDKEGIPYLFPMNGTVYQVLDITNPATYAYFTELYRMLTEDWGYTYHKLDFTRAAVIYEEADFYDKTITLAEAYYRAVSAIRKGMGEEAYFLMCGGLYDPIVGLVDAQRTGSDVLSMWSSNINKDGKTAPYTIKQSALRYYMNHWWDNDPDALMIRKNETMERNLRLTYGLLNDEEVKTSVMNQFMGGGIMCATEPLDKIGDDRLMEYRRILPVLPSVVRPMNLMEETRFPGMMDVYLEKQDAHCLCVINWEDTREKTVEICVEKLLPQYAAGAVNYLICDYYAGTYVVGITAQETIIMQPIAPHGAGLYKIVKIQDKPLVAASTGHYSMGGEFTCLEMTGDKLHYIVENPFDCTIHYEILLPDGCVTILEVGRGIHEGFR